MSRSIINSDQAPAAIGPYSQAVRAGNVVYLSGQIGLNPSTMALMDGFEAQVVQVFENLKAVAEEAGGGLDKLVKINLYLTDMDRFAEANEVMKQYFSEPYPARAAVAVRALPRDALFEAEAVMVLE